MHRLDLKQRDWRAYQHAEQQQWGKNTNIGLLFFWFVQSQTYSAWEGLAPYLEVKGNLPCYVVYGGSQGEVVFALPRWTLPYVEAEAQRLAVVREEAERQTGEMREAVMMALVPVETPLFNLIPRTSAQGIALHPFKSLAAYQPEEQRNGKHSD